MRRIQTNPAQKDKTRLHLPAPFSLLLCVWSASFWVLRVCFIDVVSLNHHFYFPLHPPTTQLPFIPAGPPARCRPCCYENTDPLLISLAWWVLHVQKTPLLTASDFVLLQGKSQLDPALQGKRRRGLILLLLRAKCVYSLLNLNDGPPWKGAALPRWAQGAFSRQCLQHTTMGVWYSQLLCKICT